MKRAPASEEDDVQLPLSLSEQDSAEFQKEWQKVISGLTNFNSGHYGEETARATDN